MRESDRQIDSALYERLLLSKGEANKEIVLELANKGVTYNTPDSFIKDQWFWSLSGDQKNLL